MARLKDSPSSEARMIAECADCTRLSCDAGHSSIARRFVSPSAKIRTRKGLGATARKRRTAENPVHAKFAEVLFPDVE